ncbi:hypothetical protein BJ165DRAFT_1535130 [Panaeolus papilionaceus]|nr:hypothetical protein BJ165DRAFT_1535130 [Panaeolus papilionaceus]
MSAASFLPLSAAAGGSLSLTTIFCPFDRIFRISTHLISAISELSSWNREPAKARAAVINESLFANALLLSLLVGITVYITNLVRRLGLVMAVSYYMLTSGMLPEPDSLHTMSSLLRL